MANAEKLIHTAFAGAPPFFSINSLLGRKDERPKVLAIGVLHTDDSAQNFVVDHKKKLESYNVVGDFIEQPYWFNAILAGYRKGVVTDKELDEHYEALIESSNEATSSKNITFKPTLEAELKKIRLLAPTDVRTIAVDVRNLTHETMSEALWDSFRRANQLARMCPECAESVKYSGFIEEALAQGIPRDAITASLVSLHLSEMKGNGVLTYGDSHFMGECRPENGRSHGIIDDVMEKQGIAVTQAVIAKDGYTFRRMENGLQYHTQEKAEKIRAGKQDWIACKDTADQMDFLYLYKGDYLLPKQSFPKHKIEDLRAGYPKPEAVYKDYELDPTLVEELREKLTEAGVTHGTNAVSLPLSQPSVQNRTHNASPPRK
jgi:hypothetical protein